MYNEGLTEAGYTEQSTENNMRQEDKKFLKNLEDGTKLANGHYQVPLPFRDAGVEFLNNKFQAQKRL